MERTGGEVGVPEGADPHVEHQRQHHPGGL